MESHKHHLCQDFLQLQKERVTLRGRKCYITVAKLRSLGHIFSTIGVWAGLTKVYAVGAWAKPTNALHHFQEFVSYYKKVCVEICWYCCSTSCCDTERSIISMNQYSQWSLLSPEVCTDTSNHPNISWLFGYCPTISVTNGWICCRIRCHVGTRQPFYANCITLSASNLWPSWARTNFLLYT